MDYIRVIHNACFYEPIIATFSLTHLGLFLDIEETLIEDLKSLAQVDIKNNSFKFKKFKRKCYCSAISFMCNNMLPKCMCVDYSIN